MRKSMNSTRHSLSSSKKILNKNSLWAMLLGVFLLGTTSMLGQIAYVANQTAGTVSVVDLSTESIITTIDVQSGVISIAAAPDGSQLAVVSNTVISFIDPSDNSVIDEVNIPNGSEVRDVFYSADGSTAFVVDQLTTLITPFNAADQTAGAFGFVSPGVAPLAGALAENGLLVTVNNGSADLATFTTNPLVQTGSNIGVGQAPQDIAFLPGTNTAYVSNFNTDDVSVVDVDGGTVTETVSDINDPLSLVATPDGAFVYVVGNDGIVTVINTSSNSIETTITVGATPRGIAVTPDGSTVVVTNSGDNSLSLIDVATNTVSSTVDAVGDGPLGVAVIEAAAPADPIIRLTQINTGTETVVIENFGTVAEDISSYQLCLGPGQYNILSGYSNITGDLDLAPGENVTIDVTSGSGNVTALPAQAGLGLFSTSNFSSDSPDDLEDYVQWGAGNQARVDQAVLAGRWDDEANFVGDNSPYNYDGGAEDVGSTFWSGTPNMAPDASFTATPTSGDEPLNVSFDASASSDEDGTIASYDWDFGDGTTGTGVTTSNTFTAGEYTVTLTVTDNNGATDMTTQIIMVNDTSLAGILQTEIEMQTLTDVSGLNFGGVSAALILPDDSVLTPVTGQKFAGVDLTDAELMGASEVTQTIFAALTLALMEEDALMLSQQVDEFIDVSALTNIPGTITIEQLLRHTSGLDNFAEASDYTTTVLFDVTRNFTAAEITEEFVDAPGTPGEFSYSNTNFLVLGLVLEEANGSETLQESIERLLETPAEITGIDIYGSSDPADLAPVFDDVFGSGFPQQLNPNTSVFTGASFAGNIYATPSNFIQLFEALAEGDILDPVNFLRLIDFVDLDEDERLSEKYGLGIEEFRLLIDSDSLDFIGHLGGINYGSVVLYSCDAETGVFLSTNNALASEEDVLELARKLLDIAIDASEVEENQAPEAVISADATAGDIGLTVNFDGSGSTDEDGSVVLYDWDFGNGSTASGASASATYEVAGTFTVTLTVTDNKGLTATATETITISAANLPPTAVCAADPTSGDAPLTVAFDGTGSTDSDGTIESYAWDFGDGNTATGAMVSTTYGNPGTFTAQLIVTDNDGASDTCTVDITVEAPNVAPTAVCAADPTSGDAPLTVAFDGTGSTDSDGTIESYAWDFGDGNTATGAMVSTTYGNPGTFTAQLIVTDNDGASDTCTVDITVEAPNVAPTAVCEADPESGVAPLAVAFSGANSTDSDGTIESYAWDFGDGNTATGATASNTYTDPGTYTAQLIVTDNEGAADTCTVDIVVVEPAANIPPVAVCEADPEAGIAPLTVAFSGTSSTDQDGTIESYAWEFGDGNSATGASVTNTYADPGTYTAQLIVTDNEGAADTCTVDITVEAPNVAPTAVCEADPESGVAPLTVAFDGTGSTDSDGTIESYAWDFGDGNTATGVTASNTYTDPGTYTAQLIVTDNDGASDTCTVDITVLEPAANIPPTAVCEADPTSGDAPLTVAFDGTGSTDSDGTIESYAWDFGDGNTATTATGSNTYAAPGTYTAQLIVTDNEGASDTCTVDITVTEPAANMPPMAVCEADPTSGDAPLTVSI